MISHLLRKDIDTEKWDRCIDNSVNGIFYAYSWVLDMVCPGWNALVMDNYLAVMPLPNRMKFGVRYIYPPFFLQQLGVFSTGSLTETVTESFLKSIPLNYRYWETTLNTFNRLPNDFKARKLPRRTHELDLSSAYSEIRTGYSQNTLHNMKKAEKASVFIASQGRPEEIIDAFRTNRGKGLKRMSDADYNTLKHLVYSGIHRGMVRILSAYDARNSFCAGIIFMKSHHKAVFLFSGANPIARENGAMFLLVDHFIREFAGNPLILDFEGATDPNLARFYAGFGSKESVFLQLSKNRLPLMLRPMVPAWFFFRNKLSL